MLDCGIHPGYSGMASLPYLDQVALEEVDVMLVTHFHLDHCAAMPFVTAKTAFRVRRCVPNLTSSHAAPLFNASATCAAAAPSPMPTHPLTRSHHRQPAVVSLQC